LTNTKTDKVTEQILIVNTVIISINNSYKFNMKYELRTMNWQLATGNSIDGSAKEAGK